MAKKSLFSMDSLKNRPSRNGFDMGYKNAFTAKAGELLPVDVTYLGPGDSFRMPHQHFTRTAPVESAAYTRIREYYDWFFVPFRLLWKSAPSVLTMMTDNPLQADTFGSALQLSDKLPHVKLSTLIGKGKDSVLYKMKYSKTTGDDNPDTDRQSFFGFDRVNGFAKLFSYLNYGYLSDSFVKGLKRTQEATSQSFAVDHPLNLFAFQAYQKIYCDYFRNSQWEKAQPWTYNVDWSDGSDFSSQIPAIDDNYWKRETMFDLRYCNWNKDLFMGVMPNTQFGNVSVVNVDVKPEAGIFKTSPNSITGEMKVLIPQTDGSNKPLLVAPNTDSPAITKFSSTNNQKVGSSPIVTTSQLWGTHDHAVNLAIHKYLAEFNILALRQAEFLQRWKEISQSGQQDYKAQVEKHFGVTVSSALSSLCTFIGGSAHSLDISEVVNQNLTGEDGLASIYGKGVGAGNGKVDFVAKEHGIMMCIYHAVPLLDYQLNACDMQHWKTEAGDFAIPEFDRIGMQELPFLAFDNTYENYPKIGQNGLSPLDVYGYVPRYIEYKTKIDRIHGAFCSTLPHWVAPISPAIIKSYLTNKIFDDGKSIVYNWFKVNPHVLDSIFGVQADSTVDTDTFRINFWCGQTAVRPYDYDGMAY